jgi:hypothetical protein
VMSAPVAVRFDVRINNPDHPNSALQIDKSLRPPWYGRLVTPEPESYIRVN